jgi:hypothetical protein
MQRDKKHVYDCSLPKHAHGEREHGTHWREGVVAGGGVADRRKPVPDITLSPLGEKLASM